MVTVRDLEKTLSLLRRVYEVVIVDTPAVVNDINLAFLDASDTILEIVTYDSTTIHSTMVMADAFRMIGYPPTKVRYLVNRADSTGGFDPEVLTGPSAGVPEHNVSSGGALVVRANNEGIPFVLADPAAQISQDVARTAASWWAGWPPPRRGGREGVSDPRPIGVFDSGVGGLTVLREILRRSPHESTIYLGDNARAPYGVRSDDEVRRFSMEALDELASRDVKALVVACNTSTAVALRDLRARYDLPVLGVVRPGAAAAALATRNRRVGVIATPATVRSHAYFNAIKDENPAVEVYEHATPRFVPHGRGGRSCPATELEAVVEEELAPLLGERDGAGEFVFPRPPSAKIDTLLLGCTHYPLLRPILTRAGRRPGRDRGLGDGDGGDARGAAVGERARGAGTTRGTAADPGAAGHSRPAERTGAAHPRPAHDGRRRALPVDRVADVRRVVPGRGVGGARGCGSADGRRPDGARSRRAAAGSPRSACGRSGSSWAPSWAPR